MNPWAEHCLGPETLDCSAPPPPEHSALACFIHWNSAKKNLYIYISQIPFINIIYIYIYNINERCLILRLNSVDEELEAQGHRMTYSTSE